MDDSKTNPDVSKSKTLSLKDIQGRNTIEHDRVRQSFAHGRTKTVEVEVRRRRVINPQSDDQSNVPRSKSEEFEVRFRAAQEALRQQTIKESEEDALKELVRAEEIAKSQIDSSIKEDQEQEQVESEIEESSIAEAEFAKEDLDEVLVAEAPASAAKTKTKVSVPLRPAAPRKTLDDIVPIILKSNEYQKSKPASSTVVPTLSKDAVVTSRRSITPDPTVVAPNPDKPVHRPSKSVHKKHDDDENSAHNRYNKGFDRKFSRQDAVRALEGDDDGARRRRARKKQQGHDQVDTGRIARDVIIYDLMTVSDLANRMAIRAAELVKSLMKMGRMVTVNEPIDIDTAELLCMEFGHNYKRVADNDIEEGLISAEDSDDLKIPRPPIVTIMGHVDHGKTSLLDALRQTDVAAGEAGGITQHIGAYQITLGNGPRKGQKITFIDTPGHAAFSSMRARGANMTDVVILVVAADDGIKEQTIEAIRHAQAANVPIVVAINKMDKHDANPDRVRTDLMAHGIIVESFGGDVLSIEVSARNKTNLDALEEAVLLQAEILNLRANPDRSAEGVVIEARMDKGRGPLATVLVNRGTLKNGDIIVAGTEWGRVRVLLNDRGQKCNEALPGMPVEVVGFDGVPSAGDMLVVVENDARAREIAEYRSQRQRLAKAVNLSSMESVLSRIAAGDIRELPLIVKADVHGSVEAIVAGLGKMATGEVSARVLHSAVGGINESDITLARASGALILAFNVRPNTQARDMAKRDAVDVRTYSVIYDLFEDMKQMMAGLLAPTLRDKELGRAEVRDVFSVPKAGRVAGCYVLEGMIKRGSRVRIIRDNVVLHEGALKTLKRFKDDVREVKDGYECGLSFENYNDIQSGDIIECFEVESIKREL